MLLGVLGALLGPLEVFRDQTHPLQRTFGEGIWLRGVDIWLGGSAEYLLKTLRARNQTPKEDIYPLPISCEHRLFKKLR